MKAMKQTKTSSYLAPTRHAAHPREKGKTVASEQPFALFCMINATLIPSANHVVYSKG